MRISLIDVVGACILIGIVLVRTDALDIGTIAAFKLGAFFGGLL